MVPDTGERYLSTPLFTDIAAEMDEAEWAISRSTPRSRFDAPAPTPAGAAAPTGASIAASIAAPEPAAGLVAAASAVPVRSAALRDAPAAQPDAAVLPVDGLAFVESALADAGRPVVMFGMKWCEFGWAVRRLFDRIEAPLRVVELDDPALQNGDRAGAIRAALAVRAGSPTLPQLFVGGQLLGGCNDTLGAWDDGRLPRLLQDAEVPFASDRAVDTQVLLPGWVQPR
jgi:cysteine synthase A